MEEEEKNKETNSDKILVIILLMVIICFFACENMKYQMVKKSKHYTIAKIYSIKPSDGSWSAYFSYKAKNAIPFDGSQSIPTKEQRKWIYHPEVGERYYVKFLWYLPSYAVICLDRQVPDSIKEAPIEGWLGDLPCADE